MKIITYNLNGVRSAIKKGLIEWIKAVDADIYCFQEIKCAKEDLPILLFDNIGYGSVWLPAEKKGYSGTGILFKKKPVSITYGCGEDCYDREGRVLIIDTEDLRILNTYMPSGSSGEERQKFKFEWLDFFMPYITQMREEHPNLLVCGDFNICHQAIDIHNPKSNAQSSGFLPEERDWMEKYFQSGFIDTFRYLNSDPHFYTWWSNRMGARDKNLGWRIDYQTISANLLPKLNRSIILNEAKHSDHCPVLVELNI